MLTSLNSTRSSLLVVSSPWPLVSVSLTMSSVALWLIMDIFCWVIEFLVSVDKVSVLTVTTVWSLQRVQRLWTWRPLPRVNPMGESPFGESWVLELCCTGNYDWRATSWTWDSLPQLKSNSRNSPLMCSMLNLRLCLEIGCRCFEYWHGYDHVDFSCLLNTTCLSELLIIFIPGSRCTYVWPRLS